MLEALFGTISLVTAELEINVSITATFVLETKYIAVTPDFNSPLTLVIVLH